MSSPVIQAEKLSKWYGNILGISEISVEVAPGIKGLLGPNGAGKSTFLKILAGQLKPSLGKLTIFGEKALHNYNLFQRIGFCPEYDSFYTEMTGRQFISFMSRLHGFQGKSREEKASRALDLVGLGDCQDRLISTYSFGMRQRLRLAASIVHEPELLLLDEPLRGVDPLWRIKIVNLIKDYEKQGKTILVSSHILPEVEAMTSDIILIHQGKVFAEGNIQYIRGLMDTHPHQIFVKCSQPRQLAQEFIGKDYVVSAEFDPKSQGITFKTNQRDLFFSGLTGWIATNNLEVEEITSPDDNLQAVFDYLIGR